MSKKAIHSFCAAIVLATSIAATAQTPAATGPAQTTTAAAERPATPEGTAPTFIRAETPEQHKARVGTSEDPGLNPDPEKVWWRYGKAYQIHRYDRDWAVYTGGPGEEWIRPFGFVNSYRELYQHNDKYVWVWETMPDLAAEAPAEDLKISTESSRRYTDGDIDFLSRIRSEFTELNPPESKTVIRFEESSAGLPYDGNFRNVMAIADMDGDGNLDLLIPPERAGGFAPAIYRGDGKGNWKYWSEVIWPHAIDYGSAAAADFNGDGKMDVAFGVHLQGIYVWYGDGKGHFTEPASQLPRDFGTRRLIATDVDRDGKTDIVAISEGPTAVNQAQTDPKASKLRVYLNRKNGEVWQPVNIADMKKRVGGDWLSAGDFNGDRYPDFAASSIYFSSPDTLYLSKGKGEWQPVDAKLGAIVPYVSYYFASTAGRFSSKTSDDALVSFVRFWPSDINPKLVPHPPLREVTGVDRVTFTAKGPKRVPVMRWGSKFGVSGMATGDFDGDGKTDLIFTMPASAEKREVVILLGNGKGDFTRAKIDGLVGDPHSTYDLKVADVNGDKRPDVIIMYEADNSSALSPRDGSIHVYLNRGPARTPASTAGVQ